MKPRIQLDGNSLTLRDVWLVAQGDGEVELAPGARRIVAQRRHFVDEIVRRGDVVYGVTTGFGKLSDIVHSARQAGASCRSTSCAATRPAWARCCPSARCAR